MYAFIQCWQNKQIVDIFLLFKTLPTNLHIFLNFGLLIAKYRQWLSNHGQHLLHINSMSSEKSTIWIWILLLGHIFPNLFLFWAFSHFLHAHDLKKCFAFTSLWMTVFTCNLLWVKNYCKVRVFKPIFMTDKGSHWSFFVKCTKSGDL